MSVRTRWLSTYVEYQCRHAGACCTSGWPIPIEVSSAARVERAVQARRIETTTPWLVATADQPVDCAGLVAVDADRRCVFLRDHRCAIHGAIGEAALPSACRHFPRVVLIDPRGVFVTLSHYCPTVAAMLVADGAPPAIVEGPPALPDGELPEGLDAREAWPPVLRPGVLMEHAAYALWETHMVAVLGRLAPDAALLRLEEDVDRLAPWTPDDGALADRISTVISSSLEAQRACDSAPEIAASVAHFERVRGAVPSPLRWDGAPDDVASIWRELVAPAWSSYGALVGRYLAARAFGSWVAYQGSGLAAIVRSLRASLAVLQVESARACARTGRVFDRPRLIEAVRRSDLLLVHYADRQHFADLVSC